MPTAKKRVKKTKRLKASAEKMMSMHKKGMHGNMSDKEMRKRMR